MIVKNIETKDVILLIEEQKYKGNLYRISKSYSPKVGIDEPIIRISISHFNQDNSIDCHVIEHGIDIVGNKLKSFWLYLKKNGSSKAGAYSSNNYEYLDEIQSAFEDLIESGNSEFTDKALSLLENISMKVK